MQTDDAIETLPRRRNNLGQRQRNKHKRRMERASQQELQSTAASLGSSFLSPGQEADDHLQAELADDPADDVPGCWVWLKERGYVAAPGVPDSCNVLKYNDTPWNEHVEASITQVLGEEYVHLVKSIAKSSKVSDSTFVLTPTGRGATASWWMVAAQKVVTREIEYLSPREMCTLVWNIGEAYHAYASPFETHSIDSRTAKDMTEQDLIDFNVHIRVHRLRILQEFSKFKESQPHFDIIVARATVALKQTWWRRLWLATLSPAPRSGELQHRLQMVLKATLRKKLRCQTTGARQALEIQQA